MLQAYPLTRQQQIRLLTDFVREQFARKGMVADVNLHSDYAEDGARRIGADPSESRNDHAHLLVTMRRLEGDAFKKTKTDAREWNSRDQLNDWRAQWAAHGAKALRKAGHDLEADRFSFGHLTLPEQRQAAIDRGDIEWAEQLDREPDLKQGAPVLQMEDRGEDTERGEDRRKIKKRNAERDELKAEAKVIDLELERIKRQEAAAAAARRKSEAAKKRDQQGGAGHAARISAERDRFEEWANTRRADAQSARLDAEIKQGRSHHREQVDHSYQIALYTSLRAGQQAQLAAIARRQKFKGMVRFVYRLIGKAARDKAEAKVIRQNLAAEQRHLDVEQKRLAGRHAAERAKLARHHGKESDQLEHRIANAHERREQAGWVQERQGRGVRRNATTGHEIGPVEGIDIHLPLPLSLNRSERAKTENQEVSQRPDPSIDEEAAQIAAERAARELRESQERELDNDPGRVMD